jgi:hypothetical protein
MREAKHTPGLRRGLLLPLLLALLVLASPGRSPADDDLLAERRAKVKSLNSAEKFELVESQRRFDHLDPAEQSRLRELNRELEESPDGQELRQVMRRYYDWLKTLPAWQQADLRMLPPNERIAKMKEIMKHQAQKNAFPFGPTAGPDFWPGRFPGGVTPGGVARSNPADVEGVLSWLDQYTKRHGKEFLALVPPKTREKYEQQLSHVQGEIQRNELLGMMWLRWHLEQPGKSLPLSEQDLKELRAKVSPATRKQLEGKSAEEQTRIIFGKLPVYLLRQYAAHRSERRFPVVTEEELAEFFEKKLSPQQRDRLLGLPGEELPRELWLLYMRSKFPPPGKGWPGSPNKPATGQPPAVPGVWPSPAKKPASSDAKHPKDAKPAADGKRTKAAKPAASASDDQAAQGGPVKPDAAKVAPAKSGSGKPGPGKGESGKGDRLLPIENPQ